VPALVALFRDDAGEPVEQIVPTFEAGECLGLALRHFEDGVGGEAGDDDVDAGLVVRDAEPVEGFGDLRPRRNGVRASVGRLQRSHADLALPVRPRLGRQGRADDLSGHGGTSGKSTVAATGLLRATIVSTVVILTPGDVLVSRIEGLGEMTHHFRRGTGVAGDP
jgi:hypothetical protein